MEDVRYIPDDLYYTAIDQHFNNRKYGWGVNDKNYYSLLFPDVKQPETIVRKINGIYYDASYHMFSEDCAMRLCGRENGLIIKPANETGGSRGIKFWKRDSGVDNLRHIFRGGGQLRCSETYCARLSPFRNSSQFSEHTTCDVTFDER